MRPQLAYRRRTPWQRAFTIVEVLATLTLTAIVLPAVVHGVLLCLATAGHARHQAQAASLAQSKMAEIVTSRDFFDTEMAGDFGEDLPGFTWVAQMNNWEDGRLAQLDVSVMWTRRNQEHHINLSTLVYVGQPNE